jgi:hypothetical protein
MSEVVETTETVKKYCNKLKSKTIEKLQAMLLKVKRIISKPSKKGKRRTNIEMDVFKEWQKKEIERKF